MDVIVDDHLLLQILLNEEPPDFRAPGARIFTTGLWYHRLCSAVSINEVTGAMSRRLGRADPAVAAAAARAITTLPETMELLSLRKALLNLSNGEAEQTFCAAWRSRVLDCFE